MPTCDQCGFEYAPLGARAIVDRLATFGARFNSALDAAPASLARRPDPTTWSALEYACHVRDVLLVQRDRVVHALVEESPGFFPMHREERAALAGYATEDPATVAQELEMAARLLARLFAGLSDEQLARTCVYNFPSEAEVDLAWVGVHTLHEGEHHLWDVRRVLERLAGGDTVPRD